MVPSILIQFLHDDDGATAIEYGLIAALVVGSVILGATALSGTTESMYDKWSGDVQEAIDGAS